MKHSWHEGEAVRVEVDQLLHPVTVQWTLQLRLSAKHATTQHVSTVLIVSMWKCGCDKCMWALHRVELVTEERKKQWLPRGPTKLRPRHHIVDKLTDKCFTRGQFHPCCLHWDGGDEKSEIHLSVRVFCDLAVRWLILIDIPSKHNGAVYCECRL